MILVKSIKSKSCAATEGGRQRQRSKRKQQENWTFIEKKKTHNIFTVWVICSKAEA